MIKKFLFSVAIFSTLAINAQQSFSGLNTSQYGGMYKGTTNPANFVDGMTRFAINVASVDASFGNNKMGINFDLKKSFNEFTSQVSSHNDINANINLDVLGPSFYFHVGRKNAFAFTSRARVFMNARDIDAKVLESFLVNSKELNLSPAGYSFNLDRQSISANAFSEFAFTWSRLIAKTSNHSFKAGLTAKFVRGAISSYAGFSEINGNIKAKLIENNNDVIVNIDVQGNQNAEFLLSNGGVNITKNPNFSDILKPQASTLGFDLGFVYEYRKEGCPSCTTTPYDLKLGLSFTDIGRLKYSVSDDSQKYSLNLGNHNINLSDIQKSMDESLFVSKTSLKGSSITSSLPTSLRLNADVRVTGPIFVDVSANFNITNTSKVYNSYYASGLVVTPRVEWKYVGFYLPVSTAVGMGTNVGTAVRLGPLFIGSRSLVSNLLSKNAKQLNVFGGLQFEI